MLVGVEVDNDGVELASNAKTDTVGIRTDIDELTTGGTGDGEPTDIVVGVRLPAEEITLKAGVLVDVPTDKLGTTESVDTSTNDDVTTDGVGLLANVPIDVTGLSSGIESKEVEQIGRGPDVTADNAQLSTGVTTGGSGVAANVMGDKVGVIDASTGAE